MVTGRGGAARSLLGLVVFAALVIWFGIVAPQRDAARPAAPLSNDIATAPAPDKGAAPAAGPETAPVGSAKDAAAQPQPGMPGAAASPDQRAAEAPAPGPGPAVEAPPSPSFDVVRVEPNGDSVIAGRGAPGATIDMLRNGEPHARVMADASGLFAFVPPPLPPGSNEIVLQSIAPDGTRTRSRDSVTAVIAPDRKTAPLVALTAPDKPTVILSAPEPAAVAALPTPPPSAAGSPAGPVVPAPPVAPPPAVVAQPRASVRIASVETQAGGRLFVSGQGAPHATVRLYLNDSFVAPGAAGADGRLSFAIEKGVRPGDYQVRLDDVDPVSGRVRSRAEVGFTVPPIAVAAIEPAPARPARAPDAKAPDAKAPDTNSPDAKSDAKPSETTSPSAGLAPRGATSPSAPVGSAPGSPAPGILVPGVAAPPGPSPDSKASSAAPTAPPTAAPSQGGAAPVPAINTDPGTIVVPEINTAMVARGDNLWRISRRVYGQGIRYTVIYGANQPQIRNASRIYPGQVFVLPAEGGAVR